jgi:hypothetical protein
MRTGEYFFLIFSNFQIFTISAILSLIVYYAIFKRYIFSLLDPLLLSAFFSYLGFTTVLFLYFTENITLFWLSSYLFTQFAFFLGFIIIKPLRLDFNIKLGQISSQQKRLSKWMFIISGLITISSTLLIYIYKGIPIFAASRLNIIGDDTVFKIINRISKIVFPVYMFLTIYFVSFSKKRSKSIRNFAILSLLVIVGISILSGSRSKIMAIGFGFFIYSIYATRWGDSFLFEKIKKFSLRFLIIAFVIAIISFYVGENSNPFYFLIFRLASSGDAYFMGYPNSVLEIIPKENWFVGLFASPLNMLGLINETRMPEPIGFQLMEYYSKAKLFRGPNARHNILGYVYFGYYWSIFFSFTIGLLLSYVRNKVYFKLPKNIFGSMMYFLLLLCVLNLETDFYMGLASLIDIVFIFIPLYIITIIIDQVYVSNTNK